MATDITRRAGKGLQKQLLASTPLYRQRHEEIFGKRAETPQQAGWEEPGETKPLTP